MDRLTFRSDAARLGVVDAEAIAVAWVYGSTHFAIKLQLRHV